MKQSEFKNAQKVMGLYPHNIHHGLDKKGQPIALFKVGKVAFFNAL